MSKVAAGTKVAVFTGGTSGIGLAAVKALREKGCTVYALSRRGEIPCDVSEVNSVRAAVQTVLDKEGRIDILVNCAGFGISGAGELTPLEAAKKQLDVNLYGTANMVNAVIPAMRQQGGGRIVNTGSVAGFVPIPFQTWYSASIPPASCATALAALRHLEQHPELPQRLSELSEYFRTALKSRGVAIRESKTPIVPIFTYQAERTMIVANALYEDGVYVNTVLPPAAPADGCMLRTSLMATHTEALLDEAADVLQRVLEADHE